MKQKLSQYLAWLGGLATAGAAAGYDVGHIGALGGKGFLSVLGPIVLAFATHQASKTSDAHPNGQTQ